MKDLGTIKQQLSDAFHCAIRNNTDNRVNLLYLSVLEVIETMAEMDKAAVARIKELEDEVTELHVVNDLLREDYQDVMTQLRVAKAQLALVKQNRQVSLG